MPHLESQPGTTNAASQDSVTRAHSALPLGLPAPLAALYRLTDGLHTDAGVVVYPAGEIAGRNETFDVAGSAPGYVLFGDDSGGRGFLLSVGDTRSQVFSGEMGDLRPEGFRVEAEDFPRWLGRL